jgi:hypothetical protein
MLRFLGAVDGSDCLDETLWECRDNADEFTKELRDRVIGAYARAGCGSPASLGWLGRDKLANEEIRGRLGDRGPFSGHDLTKGGHKNAFYCLCALHGLLLSRPWLHHAKEPPREETPRTEETPAGSRGASACGSQDGQPPETRVLETRFPDVHAAREFLGKLLDVADDDRSGQGDAWMRVPVAFNEQGQMVMARIWFETPAKPGHLAKLGRVLEKMGEAMEEENA